MSWVAQVLSNYKSGIGISFREYTIVVSTGAALRSSERYELVMAFGRVFPIAAVYVDCEVSIGLAEHKDFGSAQSKSSSVLLELIWRYEIRGEMNKDWTTNPGLAGLKVLIIDCLICAGGRIV